ncbi:threonine synthase [Tindallia californiensis]|uniref:Threonine synthase n=1 Tax=Tindallia californiensis TaxID=159292 RepID=A0A1H3ILC5_9FIRM|nr:threonine synthase [Tindallia californiensis]SDY28643.1 L-threonine synthase [Tindallia californiensis]
MEYISTRAKKDSGHKKTSAQAIIKGIAEDDGLFVPKQFPEKAINPNELVGYEYQQIAKIVLSHFFTDFSQEELETCVNKAYDSKFDTASIAPLIDTGDVYFLELFHGKTAAFKDMALSILPHLLTTAIEKEKESRKTVILAATSGDTGKAALEGFADVEGTEIIVFYPHIGVSQVQERQMITQKGDNTHVFAIKGNFDDAQAAVKKIFADKKIEKELTSSGYQFSSANSINIGRLVPQVAYYIWAYVQMITEKKIENGDAINIVVPTGNFGNILAAFYAKELGIPVNKLICASNRNNVLTDFINTGVYDIRREFHITSSPSMDILISSNLERLLYHLSGGNGERISRFMQDLKEKKHYVADDYILSGLDLFYANYANEEETMESIRKMYQKNQYLMDPHTAVAYKVYEDYKQKTNDKTPTIISATASAYKFADTVVKALGLPDEEDGFEAIARLYQHTGVKVPKELRDLKSKEIRHQKTLECNEMEVGILETLRKRVE